MMRSNSVVVLAVLLAGCASRSADVAPSYVSPPQYQGYDCYQLVAEAQRLSARAAMLAGVQDQKRTSDMVVTTVGVIIFWPVLFAVSGDDATTAELANLKGQMNAIEQASIQKNCGIQFQRS
jgi:hypothetical protein